jgi:predicted transcriptional regulator
MAERMPDVAFLARSEHRFAVLDAVDETPRSRKELQATTGASRVTIGRIVTELERRGWIRSTDDGYRTTPIGHAVAASFAGLRETLDAAAVLEPLAPSLPNDFLSLDIGHFRDASVTRPSKNDPLAAARTAAQLMNDADDVKVIAHAVTSETVASQIRATESRGQRSEVVLSTGTLEAMVGDETMIEQLRRLLRLEGPTMYRYDGPLPVSMGIYDDETVGIGTVDDASFPNAYLVSSNDEVLAWAREEFAAIRDAAERLDPDERPLFEAG